MRVEDFVSLGASSVRRRFGDCPRWSSDAECLITHCPISETRHVAICSDGRAYDAVGLHEWLRRQTPPYHVIPSQHIRTVSSHPRTPMAVRVARAPAAAASRPRAAARAALGRVAARQARVVARLLERATAPTRADAATQTEDVAAAAALLRPPRGARPLRRSPGSAFSRVTATTPDPTCTASPRSPGGTRRCACAPRRAPSQAP